MNSKDKFHSGTIHRVHTDRVKCIQYTCIVSAYM